MQIQMACDNAIADAITGTFVVTFEDSVISGRNLPSFMRSFRSSNFTYVAFAVCRETVIRNCSSG